VEMAPMVLKLQFVFCCQLVFLLEFHISLDVIGPILLLHLVEIDPMVRN